MGTSRSATQLAKKMESVAKHSGETNRKAVFAATFVYKDHVLLAGRRVAGSDMRMSRWGARRKSDAVGVKARTGRKLSAGFDIKGTVRATSILLPRPQGVWKVLEAGAPEHPMVAGVSVRRYNMTKKKLAARGYGLSKNRLLSSRKSGERQRALALAGGGFRAAVMHPGVKGRSTWSKAITSARPKAQDVFAASTFNSHVDLLK